MIPTHTYPDTFDFYKSEYIVEDGKIIAYKIAGSVWRKLDPKNKYERFPKIEDLEVIK